MLCNLGLGLFGLGLFGLGLFGAWIETMLTVPVKGNKTSASERKVKAASTFLAIVLVFRTGVFMYFCQLIWTSQLE